VVIIRRGQLEISGRRTERLELEMTPIAIRLVESDEPPPNLLQLDSSRQEALAAVMNRYARTLTGEATTRIARYFNHGGLVHEQLDALRSRRPWRRTRAAHQLGDMGSRRAESGLVQALNDRDSDVRSAAVRSLGRIGSTNAVEPVIRLMVDGRVSRATAGEALIGLGEPAVPKLLDLVHGEEDERVRATATELVGLTGGPQHAREIVTLLRDPSAEVRARAARALGRLGKREQGAALQAMLNERIPYLRTAAADALGEIGAAESLPALLEQAREDELDPARAAARAAARIDAEKTIGAARSAGAGLALREAADVALLGQPL
jgi:HEAT repeat protein